MKIKYHGSWYRIAFEYGGSLIDGRRTTLALLDVWNPKLMKWENTHILGLAVCSLKDRFTKERGRKVALAHLFTKMGMNKQDRSTFWKAYLSDAFIYPQAFLDLETGFVGFTNAG